MTRHFEPEGLHATLHGCFVSSNGKPCDLKPETAAFRGSGLGGVSNRGGKQGRGEVRMEDVGSDCCMELVIALIIAQDLPCRFLGEKTGGRPVQTYIVS